MNESQYRTKQLYCLEAGVARLARGRRPRLNSPLGMAATALRRHPKFVDLAPVAKIECARFHAFDSFRCPDRPRADLCTTIPGTNHRPLCSGVAGGDDHSSDHFDNRFDPHPKKTQSDNLTNRICSVTGASSTPKLLMDAVQQLTVRVARSGSRDENRATWRFAQTRGRAPAGNSNASTADRSSACRRQSLRLRRQLRPRRRTPRHQLPAPSTPPISNRSSAGAGWVGRRLA